MDQRRRRPLPTDDGEESPEASNNNNKRQKTAVGQTKKSSSCTTDNPNSTTSGSTPPQQRHRQQGSEDMPVSSRTRIAEKANSSATRRNNSAASLASQFDDAPETCHMELSNDNHVETMVDNETTPLVPQRALSSSGASSDHHPVPSSILTSLSPPNHDTTIRSRAASAAMDTRNIPISSTSTALPLSMQIMKPFWVMCCRECGSARNNNGGHYENSHRGGDGYADHGSNHNGLVEGRNAVHDASFNIKNLEQQQQEEPSHDSNPTLRHRGNRHYEQNGTQSSSSTSALSRIPSLLQTNFDPQLVETIISDYIASCTLYGCADRVNAGVLTTLRFSLPALRLSGGFHDSDMLALAEVLLKYGNGPLKYIKRLDFSIAGKEGRLHGKRGIRSHGAFALSKVLQQSEYIEEVYLQRNKIGPYGSSAVFLAVSTNPIVRTLMMRGCRIGERGALAFAEHVCRSYECGLKEVDLSVNHIGFRGSVAIERELVAREEGRKIEVDLEGNLVFQEVMNCVTHGLGIVLGIVGGIALSNRVRNKPASQVASYAVYSASLLVLYTSSTLYHSFFALQTTKYIFEVFDHCAIYILIAGSYTPFLRVVLEHNTMWSVYLLMFIWGCCFCGIFVEAFFPTWKYKTKFSLAMYLGMGWSCLVCLPELVSLLPQGAINLLVLGGVAYTSGVPFFVRNNNLDHSIWHCFVMAGSIFHWLGVFLYVANYELTSGR